MAFRATSALLSLLGLLPFHVQNSPSACRYLIDLYRPTGHQGNRSGFHNNMALTSLLNLRSGQDTFSTSPSNPHRGSGKSQPLGEEINLLPIDG